MSMFEQPINTFDEMVEALYDLTPDELRRLALEALLISDGPDKVDIACSYCHESGHAAAQCPEQPQDNNGLRFIGECAVCHEPQAILVAFTDDETVAVENIDDLMCGACGSHMTAAEVPNLVRLEEPESEDAMRNDGRLRDDDTGELIHCPNCRSTNVRFPDDDEEASYDFMCDDCESGFTGEQHRADVEQRRTAQALTVKLQRRTRCQITEAQAEAVASWPDDMPAEAASFEQQGWSMAFELAPRCENPGCWVCHA